MTELGEILVGTYEDFIVGYKIQAFEVNNSKDAKGKSYAFEQSFAVRCHSGSVRCLSTNENGSIVVSSGVDEMVNLLSLKKRKLIHTIEVAANCCLFAKNTHVIFGSNDGNIYIYEYKNSSMDLAKVLGGHRGPIKGLSIHPSGKVLVSISEDKTMRTWNLVKGRPAYTSNLRMKANIVRWSNDGQNLVIVSDKDIYYFDLSATMKQKFTTTKRINDIEFLHDCKESDQSEQDQGTILLAGLESGQVEFIDLEGNKSMLIHQAHETRVKSVRILKPIDGSRGNNYIFVTSSSNGTINLWSVDESISCIKELASTETGARITCMTLA